MLKDLKDMSYKDKFSVLSHWMPSIIDSIKRDLRNDHLKSDTIFVKRYLAGKNVNKATVEELAKAYGEALASGDNSEEVGEFLCNRWLLRHSELYNYFENELSKINPNFSEIEQLDKLASQKLVEGSVKQFGAPRTFLFCVLNSVVLDKEVIEALNHSARQSKIKADEEEVFRLENESLDKMTRSYEQQLSRITDKYEKKLAGLQKKYVQDIDVLKKQVAYLQRKLNG